GVLRGGVPAVAGRGRGRGRRAPRRPGSGAAVPSRGGQAPLVGGVLPRENAKSLALYFDREARRYFVYTEGTIASSEKALSMYFHVARGPTVKNVCEASVYSFDIGQFPYTIGNAQLMKELFGDRFEFIGLPAASPTAVPVASLPMECRDFSGTALLARATMRNKAWFSTRWSFCANLWMRSEKLSFCSSIVSVDGDHSAEGTYADLVNFRKLASCRNWVLMDDAGWNSTNSAWQRAKDEGIITQVECFVDMSPRPDYQFMDYPENRS
ncbi:unnamed protein product, partial [Prorocentrum cordatum]